MSHQRTRILDIAIFVGTKDFNWDFNKANLKKVLPNFHQHISCPTRGLNTLDHCYTPLNNAYKAHSLPAFGKSDHVAIFLTPEYKQRIAREPPVERKVTRWSPHSEATLQASLDDVVWDMFRASSSDVSELGSRHGQSLA